jgi:hypothetical protein
MSAARPFARKVAPLFRVRGWPNTNAASRAALHPKRLLLASAMGSQKPRRRRASAPVTGPRGIAAALCALLDGDESWLW